MKYAKNPRSGVIIKEILAKQNIAAIDKLTAEAEELRLKLLKDQEEAQRTEVAGVIKRKTDSQAEVAPPTLQQDTDKKFQAVQAARKNQRSKPFSAKEFAKIDKTSLAHGISLQGHPSGKNTIEFKAETAQAEDGLVEETLVEGKFKYKIKPGAKDPLDKIYTVKIPRLKPNGEFSSTDLDVMYFTGW
jgi:hypothetical protein